MAKTHPRWKREVPRRLLIIEALDLDVALKLATEGSKACKWKVEVRRNAAKPPAAPTARAGVQRWLRRVGNVFNDRLQAEGHWVFAGGLAAPSSATVIDNRGGEALFTDGPFVESKEYLPGFWVIQAPDLDVALKLAADGSKACNRKVEVRPFL